MTVGIVSIVVGNETMFQQMIPGEDTPERVLTLDSSYRQPLYDGLPSSPLYVTVLNQSPTGNADFTLEFRSPSMGGPFGIGQSAGYGACVATSSFVVVCPTTIAMNLCISSSSCL